ncbi:MAG: hypothetical protein ACOZNI_09595 [Myxococcota bacterium]
MIALVGAALAQDFVASGSAVRIAGVGRKDAFWRYRDDLVGLFCTVDEPGLYPSKRKWLGGSLTCEDGGQYYFYQVQVEYADWTPPADGYGVLGVIGGVEGGMEGGLGLGGGGAYVDPYAPAPSWPVGARVKLTDVSPADAHYPNRASIVGKACAVLEGPLAESGEGWWTGGVKCDDGTDFYFYQVAVTAGDAAAPAGISAAGTAVSPAGGVAAGKMVKITDVAAADALAGERAKLVGRTCSVVEAALVPSGDGLYAGRLFCDDGKSYQFFKVGVTVP